MNKRQGYTGVKAKRKCSKYFWERYVWLWQTGVSVCCVSSCIVTARSECLNWNLSTTTSGNKLYVRVRGELRSNRRGWPLNDFYIMCTASCVCSGYLSESAQQNWLNWNTVNMSNVSLWTQWAPTGSVLISSKKLRDMWPWSGQHKTNCFMLKCKTRKSAYCCMHENLHFDRTFS